MGRTAMTGTARRNSVVGPSVLRARDEAPMVEGLLCGLLGAFAAVVLLLIGKEAALPAILGHIDSSNDVKALGFTVTALILLGVGLVVGALGSGLTLRRYLKV